MKNKKTFFLILIILLLGLGWWWLSKTKEAAPRAGVKQSVAGAGSPSRVASHSPAGNAASLALLPSIVNPPADGEQVNVDEMLASPAGQKRIQASQQAADARNAAPINFYGKVVDQQGQPVVGANVTGSTVLIADFEHTSGEKFETTTDGQGSFSFAGLHGIDFGVVPKKDGYYYDLKLSANRPPNYAKGNSNDPVIFTMWKIQGAESLVTDNKFYGIIPDGRVFTIDLIQGKKIEDSAADGDLRVTIQRPAQIQSGQKFDWSFSMEAVGGGVLETHDPYLFEAPDSGYQEKYTVNMVASDSAWEEEIQSKVFYIKTRDGKVYGHIKIEIIPKYNDTGIFSVESVVNPNGSRNLEFDESKATAAGK